RIAAELAYVARDRDRASAVSLLANAIDRMEQGGSIRGAALARRDLGRWRIEDGDRAGGTLELRSALPMLLPLDPTAAGPAVARRRARPPPRGVGRPPRGGGAVGGGGGGAAGVALRGGAGRRAGPDRRRRRAGGRRRSRVVRRRAGARRGRPPRAGPGPVAPA